MPYDLRLTRLADEDFETILQNTLDKWGVDQFFKYEKQLLDGFAAIGADPGCLLSKSRDDLYVGAMLYPVGKHYLVYWVSENTVIVDRILYQGMDLARHLENRES